MSVVVGLLCYGDVAATAATPTLIPPIAADYQVVGGASSPLGNPTSSTLTTPCGNGQYNSFQGGTIAYSPATGAQAVYGFIGLDYQDLGAMCGPLGLPLTNEEPTYCGGARTNYFQNGRILWTGPTGAQETQGVINAEYNALGGSCSPLGLPLNSESPSACIAGARYNNFQNGRITWTGPTGAQETQGLINQLYMSMGAECSVLGLPLNSESPSACIAGARYNNFQYGRITWSASTGAHETQGVIGGLYAALGAECSPLGLPTTSEENSPCTAGARINFFENGAIEWTPDTGAHSIQGLMYGRWINQCGKLGLPLSEAYACGTSTCQNFQGGVVSVAAGSCINTPTDFANAFLTSVGEPDNPFNVQAVVAWEQMEGGNWENTAFYNPIDTTQPYDGSTPINSVGVQAYRSWRDGITANTITILNGFYGGILAALNADDSLAGEVAVARAVGDSPWGTPDFESLLGDFYQPPNPPNVVACSA